MRKFFSVVARIFASFFAIIFVVMTILALLLTTFERQAFNPNLYKRALTEQKIYERLPEIIGVTLTSTTSINPCAQNPLSCKIDSASPELQACLKTALGQDAYVAIGSGIRKPSESELQLAQPCLDQFEQPGTSTPAVQNGIPLFMQNLRVSDWETIIKLIIPPPELKLMTENVLDQVFSYLNEETDMVKVSLVKIKDRLSGQSGVDVIRQLLKAQTPCTQEQLDQISSTTGTEGAGLVLCNPTETDFNKVMRQVQEQLNAAVSQLPNEVILIEPTSPATSPANSGPLGNDPAKAIRLVRLTLRLSPLLPLGFLLLVTLFGVRTLKGWMRWWGIPFFFAGMIALGLGIAAMPALNWVWNTYVVVRIPPFIPTNITDVGHELVRYILRSLTVQIVLQAIVLVLVGLAAWIGSYFIKTKTGPQAPTIMPTPAP